MEQTYNYSEKGMIPEATLMNGFELTSDLLVYPGANEWWQLRKSYFNAEFVQKLEVSLEQAEFKEMY